jgi:hypothetical protein
MTLTPEQFKAKIDGKIRSLNIVKEVTFPVATVMADKMRQRVFQRGIDGNDSKIGSYSTTPMYATKATFKGGGFSPQGKNAKKTSSGKLAKGSKNKSGGEVRKSMYLPGGYKQLRQVQGMETSFVNLQYTGLLFTDFSKLVVTGTEVDLKVGTKESADKIQWLSDKYGKETFKHTKSEREFFKQEVTKKLTKYFS